MGKNCFVCADREVCVVRPPNSWMVTVVSGAYIMVVVLCPNLSKARQERHNGHVYMIIELTMVFNHCCISTLPV